jgi:hypothetical protein
MLHAYVVDGFNNYFWNTNHVTNRFLSRQAHMNLGFLRFSMMAVEWQAYQNPPTW